MNKLRNIYSKNKKILADFFWRSLQIFGREGTSFFAFIIVSNLLIPEELSLYTYVSSIALLIIRFCDFGISGSTSKYTAELKETDEKKIESLIGGMVSLLGLIVVFACVFVIVLGDTLFPEAEGFLLYLLPLLILSPFFYLYEGVLRGLRKFKLVAIVSFGTGILTLLLSYFLIAKFDLVGAFISQNIQYLLLVGILFFYVGKISFKFDKELIKNVLKYAFVIGLANVGLYLYTRADVILLGQGGFLEYVSYYEVSNKIFMIILLPSTILGTVVAPRITAKFAKNKFNGMIKDLKTKVVGMFLLGFFCSLIIYLFLPLIIKLVFSQYDFELVRQFIIILLILLPFRYVSSFLTTGYITSSGYARISAYPLLAWGVVNVLLGYFLIRRFGYIGVMYATLISQVGFMLTKDGWFILKVLSKIEK